MTINARFVFLALAFICFILAAFDARVPRVNLTASGLALLTLAQLIV